MAKVLITADIHISDYRNYNVFGANFRLHQFETLADRIIWEIEQNPSIEALIIAGDFLHVASPRPYVVNQAFGFLDRISSSVPVYLTHGQHDIDTRRTDISNNTLLTLSNLIPSVSYLHNEYTVIGGKRFFFLGWVPNVEEELQNVKTDVLISHFQPGTVQIGQRNFLLSGGKDVPDNPGWHIGFVGDVHTHQVTKGNIVIPGVPIQHSFNDPVDTGFILFDTETYEWERISTRVPDQWNFFQFVITDDNIPQDDWVVTRPRTVTTSRKIQQIVDKRLDVGSVLEDYVNKHTLMSIHTEILSHVSNSIRQEVDLNFVLEKIIIHDFRSIQHFEWDNIGEGVKLLFGHNGTGKSSLVTALIYALSGEGSGRNLTRKGSNNMYVEVTLLYGRNRHTIRRGWTTSGKLRYWINDAEQQAENQRGLLEKIEENLPFLRFVDLMYHQQDRPGFLSSYNYSARVDLISRVLGLRIVDALYEESKRQLLDIDRQLANIRAKIATVNTIVEQESFVDFTVKEINDDKEAHLKTLQSDIKVLIREERRKHEDYTTKKATLANSIERETREITTLERRQDVLESQICYTCGQRVGEDTQTTLLEESRSNLCEKRRRVEDWNRDLSLLSEVSFSILEKLEQRLETVTGKISEIVSMRAHQENLYQLKSRIDTAKIELITLHNEHSLLASKRDRLDEYKMLLEPAGPVMRTLLVTLSDIFSSDQVRVRAHKQLVNGDIRPDFTVDINVAGSWIEYDSASGGQKTLADMIVFERLIQLSGGLGLVVFDETFKFLDPENLEKTIEVLKQINCSNIFVVSHVENFPYFDTAIQTTTDDDHITKYIIR